MFNPWIQPHQAYKLANRSNSNSSPHCVLGLLGTWIGLATFAWGSVLYRLKTNGEVECEHFQLRRKRQCNVIDTILVTASASASVRGSL